MKAEEKMTKHDLQLVEMAYRIRCADWDLIKPEEAETPEGKERLRTIQNFKYHRYERKCGLD